MQSYTPAEDAKTATARREAVELCGKNRGPHDLIPIEWAMTATNKRVTRMMCRVCYSHIAIAHLIENYPDVKL